jgi:hypothetical protein
MWRLSQIEYSVLNSYKLGFVLDFSSVGSNIYFVNTSFVSTGVHLCVSWHFDSLLEIDVSSIVWFRVAFVLKFMDINLVEGQSIFMCTNTTAFLLETKVSFILKDTAFFFIFREVTSYACLTCCMFPQVHQIFVCSIFNWRQFFMPCVLAVMDMYLFACFLCFPSTLSCPASEITWYCVLQLLSVS